MKNTRKILSLLLAIIICLCPMECAVAFEGEMTTLIETETTTVPSTTEETTTTEPTDETTTKPTAETTTVPPTEATTTTEPTDETTTKPTAETTTVPSTEATTTTEPETTTKPTAETTTVPSTDETTTEPTTEPPVQEPESDYVAVMYVCSTNKAFGHYWIYVENLTNRPLTVGLYTLPAYEGVSAGYVCQADGWGIYYNVESYSQTYYGISDYIAMREYLDEDDLEDVSDALLRQLNQWNPFLNCMLFAFNVWNAGSGKTLVYLLFPFLGRIQMKFHSYTHDLVMKPITPDQVYRQKGTGSSKRLSHTNCTKKF